MSTIRACEGVIKAGAMPVAVGEVTGWSLEENANVKKYFKLGTCQEQSKAGAISRSLSIEGNFDPADTGQDEVVVGSEVELEIYPGGDDTGKVQINITGLVGQMTRNGSGDDLVKFSATIEVNEYEETVAA